jgi:hypothetical protein
MYAGNTRASSRRSAAGVTARPGSPTYAQPIRVPSKPPESTATTAPSRRPAIALSALSISPSSIR